MLKPLAQRTNVTRVAAQLIGVLRPVLVHPQLPTIAACAGRASLSLQALGFVGVV